ncbi:MAG: FHA domain-containing protein [Acidobacteria bacterium]|nr:FHA domain-containing protein [Acidobacteriota bacterium]
MTARLIGRTGDVAGRDYVLGDSVRIGAAREADVRIRAQGVSRLHARLWREGNDYWLEDSGSTNGTFISGSRIRKDRVRHLDIVTLGRAVDLIFLVGADGAAVAPEPQRSLVSVALEPLDDPTGDTAIPVPPGEITFGRADSNTVVIDHRAVSTVHARLERTPDLVRLQDLGSVNGTFLNAKRIDAPVVLRGGDQISLAGVRTFRVTIERCGGSNAYTDTAAPQKSLPIFSQEWKTRLVWSAEEFAGLDEPLPPWPEQVAPTPKAAARTPPPPPRPGSTREPPAPVPAPVPVATPAVVTSDDRQAAAATVVAGSRPGTKGRQIRLVGAVTAHTLAPGMTTIGRDPSATLRVTDPRASRMHAEIVVAAAGVTLEDKASVNGTVVNNMQISTRQQLADGDCIRIGDTEWTVEIRAIS